MSVTVRKRKRRVIAIFATCLAQGAVRLCSGEVSVITAPHKEKLIKPSHSNHGSAKPLS